MTPQDTVHTPQAPMVVALVGGPRDADGPTLPSGTVLITPGRQPNLVVQAVTPLAAVLVRFLNAYLTMVVGLVTAGLTTHAIPAHDFLSLLTTCAGLSLAGPALGALKDVITILTNLEKKYPVWTGNV